MRGVSFDYSDFLTVSRLAVGTQAAILSYVAGNNVLWVSEENRISNIKVSSNLMHQVPWTFLCEGYYLRYSQIYYLVFANLCLEKISFICIGPY